jgi:prepilin-type N-terminal cleavage/methylation domain-containing protein
VHVSADPVADLVARLRRRLAPQHEDGGFTLVELVMTVAILGIIAVPLTGLVLSYLRTTVDTEARLTESHDVQFASAYWQRDVASIGVRDNTYDAGSHSFPLLQSVDLAPCGLPAGAAPVVTLGWSEYTSLTSTDPPTTVKVTYASRPDASSYELLRVRCGSRPSTVQLADSLAAQPTLACVEPSGGPSCTGGGGQVPAVVKLQLQVHDATGQSTDTYTATLSGDRRQS